MPDHCIRARPPEGGAVAPPRIGRDPDVLASFLEDAAHFPGGLASGVSTPASEAEVAALVRTASSVLAIGAQSSLTGGATPAATGSASRRGVQPIINEAAVFWQRKCVITATNRDLVEASMRPLLFGSGN